MRIPYGGILSGVSGLEIQAEAAGCSGHRSFKMGNSLLGKLVRKCYLELAKGIRKSPWFLAVLWCALCEISSPPFCRCSGTLGLHHIIGDALLL